MIQFYNNRRLYVKILQEGPFTAHRFPVMMYHNGTFIYSSCKVIIHITCFTKHSNKMGTRKFAQLFAFKDSHLMHFLCRLRTNPPQFLYWKATNKIQSMARMYCKHSIWLPHIRCNLSQQLVITDSCRSC